MRAARQRRGPQLLGSEANSRMTDQQSICLGWNDKLSGSFIQRLQEVGMRKGCNAPAQPIPLDNCSFQLQIADTATVKFHLHLVLNPEAVCIAVSPEACRIIDDSRWTHELLRLPAQVRELHAFMPAFPKAAQGLQDCKTQVTHGLLHLALHPATLSRYASGR